jgi:hypothetical protein
MTHCPGMHRLLPWSSDTTHIQRVHVCKAYGKLACSGTGDEVNKSSHRKSTHGMAAGPARQEMGAPGAEKPTTWCLCGTPARTMVACMHGDDARPQERRAEIARVRAVTASQRSDCCAVLHASPVALLPLAQSPCDACEVANVCVDLQTLKLAVSSATCFAAGASIHRWEVSRS